MLCAKFSCSELLEIKLYLKPAPAVLESSVQAKLQGRMLLLTTSVLFTASVAFLISPAKNCTAGLGSAALASGHPCHTTRGSATAPCPVIFMTLQCQGVKSNTGGLP